MQGVLSPASNINHSVNTRSKAELLKDYTEEPLPIATHAGNTPDGSVHCNIQQQYC
jgi:hypothetical protein